MEYAVEQFKQGIMRPRRYGKETESKEIMREYLDLGCHVHYGNKICYNGDGYCLEFVEEQIFTGPKAPGGKTGGCSTALMGDYGSGGK